MKKALVFGAGGFIGSHMVNFLKSKNYFVRGVDLKYPDFDTTGADEFIIQDLQFKTHSENYWFMKKILLMKFINMQQIWVELDTYLLEITMLM